MYLILFLSFYSDLHASELLNRFEATLVFLSDVHNELIDVILYFHERHLHTL